MTSLIVAASALGIAYASGLGSGASPESTKSHRASSLTAATPAVTTTTRTPASPEAAISQPSQPPGVAPTVYTDAQTCADGLASYVVDRIEHPPASGFVGTDGLHYNDSMATDNNGFRVRRDNTPNPDALVSLADLVGPSSDLWAQDWSLIATGDFVHALGDRDASHDDKIGASVHRLLPVCRGAIADKKAGKSTSDVQGAIIGGAYSRADSNRGIAPVEVAPYKPPPPSASDVAACETEMHDLYRKYLKGEIDPKTMDADSTYLQDGPVNPESAGIDLGNAIGRYGKDEAKAVPYLDEHCATGLSD